MPNQVWLSQLQKHRAIAVIRAPKIEVGQQMAMAVASGGMQLIEITWNSSRAGELITQLRSELPACTIGTGTLFNVQQLEEAIASGAQFLFTPHVDSAMIQAAQEKNVPIIPGAMTPTEIVTAWSQGASCVKVFPVQAVGGGRLYQKFARATRSDSLNSYWRRDFRKCQRIFASRSDRCRFERGIISQKACHRRELGSDRIWGEKADTTVKLT